MKTMYKRILAGILAGVLAVSLFGCRANEQKTDITGDASVGGAVFAEPTELDVVIPTHVSWPYNENWIIWDYIEEATGAKLNISAIPAADIGTKLPLMMAGDGLPDLLHTFAKTQVDNYALSGAYVALSDNEEKLPNYTKYWAAKSEEEKKEIFVQRTSGDGKIYSTPTYGTHTVNNLRSWMYRKDIFEKHGLQVPTTAEELYQVAKKLKELYPDSYPICFRDGLIKLIEWGPSWEPDYSYETYYDYESGEWKIGAQEDITKDIINYFLKLKEEGLVAPDYTSMPTKSWEELMSTDRGFITLDYVVRIDFFNLANRGENPDYTLALMAPPKPDVENGGQRLMKSNLDFYGYVICNTGNEERMDNAFKFVDWMYTDDAIELLSWGKEGETYEVNEEGRKQFIVSGEETAQVKYGIGTYGTYTVKTAEANEAIYTQEQVDACHELLQYLMPKSNPTLWMPFSEEEKNTLGSLENDIKSYIKEQLEKFLLGKQSLSEWDNFQKGLSEMGAQDIIDIYTQAYNRIK